MVGDALERSTRTAWVDMSTVDTGNQDRDAHLCSSDFFDVESHPTMSYESLAIRKSGAGTCVAEGIPTINERSKPLMLTVDFAGTEIYPMDGSTHAGFSATGALSRKELGIEFNVPMGTGGYVIGDKVSIELDMQLAAEVPAEHCA